MKKSLIIGLIIVVGLVYIVLFTGILNNITGLVTGERNFKAYSSKSGIMSNLDNATSFSSLKENSYYIGGNKDYRHYEYFSLVGIPSKARIISAKLTLYRASKGEETEIRLRRVSEPWEKYYSYNTKARYLYSFQDEVLASGKEYLVFDVSEMIQEMILPWELGGGNYGFEFSAVNKTAPVRIFYFKNAANKFKPRLDIVYSTRIKVS